MNWSVSTRVIVATLLVVAYLALCLVIYYAQRRKQQQALRDAAALRPAADGTQPWLIAYASQTGSAEQLAWQTARMLHLSLIHI